MQKYNIMHDWYKTALGRAIIDCELETTSRLLPNRFYPVCVQVEGPAQLEIFRTVDYQLCCRVAMRSVGYIQNSVVGIGESLPFGANDIDLLALPHVLEFSKDPHAVLCEATSSIGTNGTLLIIGFNPRSLLNLMKHLNRLNGTIPQRIQLYPVQKIREWLTPLGFEISAGEFAFYRPPVNQANYLNKLKKLEIAGARWWPAMGSVYILVAHKKDLGVRIKPKFLQPKIKHRRFGLEYQ